MADIASAAGVVRRTVYGHFPTRPDLVRTLAEQAVQEIEAVLRDACRPGRPADAVWADFVARLWPLTRRYRVLLALRRGEYGEEIHTLLQPVDERLAELVEHGQADGVFGRHLPAQVLGQVAYAAVFTVADEVRAGGPRRSDQELGVDAATMTSLLVLGVPGARAEALATKEPNA